MSGRILIISPNWIGDAVMAQPLLAILRAAQPSLVIDVLAPPSVAPVWRQMAQVERVIETPFRHGALQLRQRWKLARQLRQNAYGAAYVLPNTLKYALIPWLAGIARRIGYKGESRHGLINVMHHDALPAKRPMVALYAALAFDPAIAAPSRLTRPSLVVGAAQIDAVNLRLGLAADRPLTVFAPGAEFGAAKRWPEAHFAALAQKIIAADPLAQVALLGAPGDHAACQQIASACNSASVINLAGATSLSEAMALIARACAVVSNDSGLLHIASALNRPVLALYGPTDPDHAPPLSDQSRSISLRLDCAPCRQRTCPLGHQNCMQGISAAMVWQQLQEISGKAT